MLKPLTERQLLALRLDSLSDSEVREVLDFIAVMESVRKSRPTFAVREDELVAMLADARENKRARQTFEWEAVRRRAERRSQIPGSRA
jgi:hypothetical protein